MPILLERFSSVSGSWEHYALLLPGSREILECCPDKNEYPAYAFLYSDSGQALLVGVNNPAEVQEGKDLHGVVRVDIKLASKPGTLDLRLSNGRLLRLRYSRKALPDGPVAHCLACKQEVHPLILLNHAAKHDPIHLLVATGRSWADYMASLESQALAALDHYIEVFDGEGWQAEMMHELCTWIAHEAYLANPLRSGWSAAYIMHTN